MLRKTNSLSLVTSIVANLLLVGCSGPSDEAAIEYLEQALRGESYACCRIQEASISTGEGDSSSVYKNVTFSATCWHLQSSNGQTARPCGSDGGGESVSGAIEILYQLQNDAWIPTWHDLKTQ